jgi:hypothetical protein
MMSMQASLRHYRMIKQGIAYAAYTFQHEGMPKPVRQTTNPLGQKLLFVLREKGHEGDLKALADALGVTVQSTYDWINHGRVAKDRFVRLVEWSGRSLDWWFDIPEVHAHNPAHAIACEPAANYANSWPFHLIPERAVREMAREDLARLEGAMLITMATMGIPLTHANG